MARTPLDPSLLAAADADRDASRLDAVVASLLPGARALAERVFAAEVLDAVDGPAQHALASIAKSALDFAPVRSARAAGLLDALTQDERDAIEAHGDDIAGTLARAWVDLWSRAAAQTDGALRVDRAAPESAPLEAAWAECAAQLGLDRAQADALVMDFCQRIRSEGSALHLPLGLVLDGRASDLWLHREGALGALPEEIVRSGEQLRAPTISLDEARKRRGS
jgi:hypothetical protein